MKLYLKLNLFIISLFISNLVLAQDGILSGRLYDQKEGTIPFATVSVMKLPDSTIVTGTTTDIEGNFELKSSYKGDFLLRFSAIGYSSAYTKNFKISGPSYSRDFGAIIMEEEATMLNEVMVETWRPRVEVDNGKMVMRVEGTAIAAGNTVFEMLSRAPGVSVDPHDNFRINGKQGVAIMIDGRLSYLSGAELQSLLESMPAENIENIEVINNPSTKYDAEGAAGILNINLKKNSLTGMNGSVYASFKYNEQQFLNGGLNLNYRKGSWNSFVNLDLAERGFVRDQKISRTYAVEEGLQGFEQVGKDSRRRFVPSLQFGSDFDINERHSVGGAVNFIYQDRIGDWNTSSRLLNIQKEPIGDIAAKNHNEEQYATGRINLHYVGDLDTLGTSLSADIDYVRFNKNSDSRFRNLYTYPDDTPESLENIFSYSESNYDIYSARIDFNTALSASSSLEMGIKASKVVSDSELQYYREEDDERVLDPALSDNFRYEEEIYAAYASYSNRFNNIWNLNLGLRLEQTTGEGISFSRSEANEKDYLEFFPNFSLEQKVSDNYKLNYSYSRRITRPDYRLLNPRIFYLDPYTYVVGNPGLEPQLNNTLQLSQTFFKKFHLMLSYDYAKNYMAEVPSTDLETRESTLSTRNMERFKSYSASLVAPFELASFWKVNNTLVINQQDYDLNIDGDFIDNNNLFYMLQSNHQVNLPAGFRMELNATFRGPMAYGVYNIDEQWWLDLGLKKSFMDDKLSLSLNAPDVFKTMDMNVTAEYSGNKFVLDQYFGNRAVSLNLRYSFSKGSKAERKFRQENLEEMSRAGTR